MDHWTVPRSENPEPDRGGAYHYDVFPTTWKGRACLVLAFVSGVALIVAMLYVNLIYSSPSQEPAGACGLQAYPGCLQAQDALAAEAVSRCDADGLVCLAPLGQVPTALVRHLVSHYQTQYGLDVLVLTPIAIPETLVDANRDQVDAVELMSFMRRRFNPYYESEGNIIGVTAVDMYSRQQPNWRYAFGQLGIEEGVVSIVRMDPTNYGAPDAETLDARVRTLVSKYIGILHYGLSPSSDPNSPMYNNILGPSDLDRMMGPLPVFD